MPHIHLYRTGAIAQAFDRRVSLEALIAVFPAFRFVVRQIEKNNDVQKDANLSAQSFRSVHLHSR